MSLGFRRKIFPSNADDQFSFILFLFHSLSHVFFSLFFLQSTFFCLYLLFSFKLSDCCTLSGTKLTIRGIINKCIFSEMFFPVLHFFLNLFKCQSNVDKCRISLFVYFFKCLISFLILSNKVEKHLCVRFVCLSVCLIVHALTVVNILYMP